MSTTKDRVALPPVNAQRTNLTCHFSSSAAAITSTSGTPIGRWPGAARECARCGLPQASASAHQHHDAGDGEHHHRKRRSQVQHHDRAGQGLLGESGAFVPRGGHSPRSHVHRRRRRQGAAAQPARLPGRPLGRTNWDDHWRCIAASPRRFSTPTDRADSYSIVSTTAAPEADTKTPGVPAS